MERTIKITLSIALFFWMGGINSFAQGKYFKVAIMKGASISSGEVVPLNENDPSIQFDYNGKSQKQLLQGVLNYLKERPGLKLDTLFEGDGPFLAYRDLATIGMKEKCFADLTALTYIYVTPENGFLRLRLGMRTKIYATINDARLSVSPDGIVISENNVPFGSLQFIRPGDYSNNGRKKKPGLAYPESIYDSEGKIINPTTKKLIEDFFDGYLIDLKNYLDRNLK